MNCTLNTNFNIKRIAIEPIIVKTAFPIVKEYPYFLTSPVRFLGFK